MNNNNYKMYEKNIRMVIVLFGTKEAESTVNLWYQEKAIGSDTRLKLLQVIKES